jgi:hypothetical protein
VGEWLLSRRDGAIVAWHEVHGTAPPKEPSRRVRSDSRRRAHRFNDWSDETSSTITEKYWLGFIKLFLATRYGALSVGISQVQKTLRYIEHQLEHHGTRTLRQEYLAFLKRHERSTRCRLLMPGAQFRRQISLGLTMTSSVRDGVLCIATRALRAWLLSCCPSGTKAIRPWPSSIALESTVQRCDRNTVLCATLRRRVVTLGARR